MILPGLYKVHVTVAPAAPLSHWLLGLSAVAAVCAVAVTVNGFLLLVPLPH
jgi:hypothetical protein